jgi:hypothetical protein
MKLSRPRSHALLDRFAKINRESYSEIGHKRLRYWQRIRTRKVRVGILISTSGPSGTLASCARRSTGTFATAASYCRKRWTASQGMVKAPGSST